MFVDGEQILALLGIVTALITGTFGYLQLRARNTAEKARAIADERLKALENELARIKAETKENDNMTQVIRDVITQFTIISGDIRTYAESSSKSHEATVVLNNTIVQTNARHEARIEEIFTRQNERDIMIKGIVSDVTDIHTLLTETDAKVEGIPKFINSLNAASNASFADAVSNVEAMLTNTEEQIRHWRIDMERNDTTYARQMEAIRAGITNSTTQILHALERLYLIPLIVPDETPEIEKEPDNGNV